MKIEFVNCMLRTNIIVIRLFYSLFLQYFTFHNQIERQSCVQVRKKTFVMKYRLASFLKIIALLVYQAKYSNGQECSYSGSDELRTKVSNTYNTMMEDFDFECRITKDCKVTVTVFTTVSTRNYTDFASIETGASFLNFYDQYVQSCEQAGMSICLISAKQIISIPGQPALNIPSGFLVVDEINKPLCYPNTCSESQFEDLNPYDKQCQIAIAAGEACNIQQKSATCPETKLTNKETFLCSSQNPRPFTQIQLTKNALYALMDAQCTEATATGTNAYCEVRNQPETRMNTATYTSFIEGSESYSNFEKDCMNSNGATCSLDFQLQYIPIIPAGARISYDYIGYPICIPNTCSSDTESLAKEFILNDIKNNNNDPLCDDFTGNCELELTDLSCTGFVTPNMTPPDDIINVTIEEDPPAPVVDVKLDDDSEADNINEVNDTFLEVPDNELNEEPKDTSSASLLPLSYWIVLFISFLFV